MPSQGFLSTEKNGITPEKDRRDKGLGCQNTPGFVQQNTKLAVSHSGAADIFGKRNTNPSQLAHFLPEILAETRRIFGIAQSTHSPDR